MKEITEMWCLVVDDHDEEGIPAVRTVSGPMPLVGGDLARMKSYFENPALITELKLLKKKMKLLKFSSREVLQEWDFSE